MRINTWLMPLIMTAAFSAQAWETRTLAGPAGQHTQPGIDNSFGFSMGFNGKTRSRRKYARDRLR